MSVAPGVCGQALRVRVLGRRGRLMSARTPGENPGCEAALVLVWLVYRNEYFAK